MINKAYKQEMNKLTLVPDYSHRVKTATEIANLEPSPRSADDVYSLGMILQDYISNLWADIEKAIPGDQMETYRHLALKQVSIKEQIFNAANFNLNQLLHQYYSTGGPVMDLPVSEQAAYDVQPFFKRIASNLLNELEVMANLASQGTINALELDNAIDSYITAMYRTMSKLYTVKEMNRAFDKLIQARQA